MLRIFLGVLALFGIAGTVIATPTSTTSTKPTTKPAPKPILPACSDGQPYPPTCGG
jgi:hypothetical protein